MSDFSTERFLNHIKHVDEDLRLMALFDLRQHLNAAAASPVVIDPVIVKKAMGCLTRDEKKEEVRQEAVATIPLLAVSCAGAEQVSILKMLLNSTTTLPSSPDDRPAFLELQDLCSLALKATVASLVGASQRDVAYWQREIDTIETYTKLCYGALGTCTDTAGKDALYSTLNTLIPVFGTAIECQGIDALMGCSWNDIQSTAALRRTAVPCCSSLAPFASEAALKQVQNSLINAVDNPGDDAFAVYLQLLEALLRSDPTRMRKCVKVVVGSLVGTLQKTGETYDSSPDVAESALRILELALSTFPAELSTTTLESILTVCGELAVFDPDYCGDVAEDAYQGDYGYEDDYYQDEYCNESADTTWKLRVGALRVLAALVAAGEKPEAGEKALKIGTAALQDRIQDAQVEGFSLIATVAARPYAVGEWFRGEALDALAAWAANGGDRASLAALHTMETVFRCVAGSASILGPSAAEKLTAILHHGGATSGNVRYAVDITQASKAVFEASTSASAKGERSSYSPAIVQLVDALLQMCGTQDRPANTQVFLEVVKCNALFIDIAVSGGPSSDRAALAHRAVDVLAGVAGAPSAEKDCRCASVEALGSWAAVAAFDDVGKRAMSAITASLLDDSLSLVALRRLQCLHRSSEAAKRIPAELLTRLTGIVSRVASDDATRQLAASVAANVVETHRPVPASDWQAWVRTASETVKRAEAAGSAYSGEELFGFLAAILRLVVSDLTHEKGKNALAQVAKEVVAPTWECLAAHSGANNNYTEVLKALLFLVRTPALAEDAAGTTRSVISFLTSAKAPAQKTYLAASAAVGETTKAEVAAAFLDRLRKEKVDRASLLLFIGGAGCVAPLPPAYAKALLDSAQDDSAELIRSSGETGLAAAMANIQNASIASECVRRASSEESVKGRYYYLKALRNALTAGQTTTGTCFSTADQCRTVVDALLAHPAEDDIVELSAACVGTIAQTYPSLCVEAISAALASGKKELRVLCAAALRFALPTMVARGEDTSVVERIVMDNLCSDLALTASPSVPVKTAILRVLASHPAWLSGRPKVFQHLLVELRENEKLVGSINIGGYSHRTDKGLEMRKTAFECLTAVMESDRTRGTRLVPSSGLAADIMNALIHSTSSAKDGEKDASINNEAKLLLLAFLRQYPTYSPTAEQLLKLCEKFQADFDAASAGSANAEQNTLLTYTIYTVIRLSKQSLFFHNKSFNALVRRAQRSELLPAALKIMPIA